MASHTSSPVFSSLSTNASNHSNSTADVMMLRGEEVTLFVTPPSASLLCPLHSGLFQEPFLAKCGHTFCKQCVLARTNQAGRLECPLDKIQLAENDFFPNLAIATQINDLIIYCRHGLKRSQQNGEWMPDDKGCAAKVTLGGRADHEKTCDHAIVACPYNRMCAPLKRLHLRQHVLTCNHIHCPHRSAGCTFEGTKPQLDEHLLGCGYESIKDYIQRNEEQINLLRTQLEEKHTENDFLKKNIIQLTSRFDQLALKLEAKTNKFEGNLRHLQASLEATQNQLADTLTDLNILKKNTNMEGLEIVDLKIPQLKCKGTFAGHNGPIWCMTVASGILISGSSDTTVKIWDLATLKCKQQLSGHTGIVHALAVIGNRLFTGSSDQSIRVWDLETYECLAVLTDHDNTVCALVVAAGHLFSGSYQHIKVWDLETYECVQSLKGHNHWVRALTVSGGYLYSGAYGVVKIWDLGNFECIHTIQGGCGSIYSLAVAPNHRLLAGTYENTIVVWDLENYEIISKLGGHIGAVYTIVISGQRFFSGSYDSTIKVWDVNSLICVQTLNRHTSSVESLVVHSGCIPYAAPPLGKLRWSNPIPATPWEGVLSTKEYKPGCIQKCELSDGQCPQKTSEDCLFLDVYTPKASKDAKLLPVMFYLHGGQQNMGASGVPALNGTSLVSNKNIIMVAHSFRLGVLGNFAASGLTGDYGHRDNEQALKWVHENIQAFGGDPDRVTLVGQSSGTANVEYLLDSSEVEGMFHQAILQSPSTDSAVRTRKVAEEESMSLFQQFNCADADLKCLRAIPAEDISATKLVGPTLALENRHRLWAPVTERSDGLTREHAYLNKVPMILGTTQNEMALFIYSSMSSKVPYPAYDKAVTTLFGEHAKRVKELYPATKSGDVRPVFDKLFTDYFYVCPMRRRMELRNAMNLTTFNYKFALPNRFPHKTPDCIGLSCHGADLPYTFGYFQPGKVVPLKKELFLQNEFESYWSNFIMNGDPSVGYSTQSEWPSYKSKKTMVLHTPAYISNDVSSNKYCDLMDEIHNEKR
eukprot:gene10570-12297_t